MRIPEQKQCVVGCPTEEEMDKELELWLVEKFWLWELALKIYKLWFENWKKEGYDDWYDDGYDKCEEEYEDDDWYDKWYRDWYDDWIHFNE